MHKKVGTITLEYDRGDGVIVSEAFQGEFNNAIFRGTLEAANGTFAGKLTAKAIAAVSNLNIRGGAAAITTISTRGYADRGTNGFDDDNVWRNVHAHSFQVPSEDINGGWAYCSMQYFVDNTRHDSSKVGWRTQYRVLFDDQVVHTSGYKSDAYFGFGWCFQEIKHFKHELGMKVGPGTHTFAVQYRWASQDTNVYPRFDNIMFQVDYVRK